VKSLESGSRAPLLTARNKNLCLVNKSFKNKPGLPTLSCP
jgi:hypothetical protein